MMIIPCIPLRTNYSFCGEVIEWNFSYSPLLLASLLVLLESWHRVGGEKRRHENIVRASSTMTMIKWHYIKLLEKEK